MRLTINDSREGLQYVEILNEWSCLTKFLNETVWKIFKVVKSKSRI